MPFKGLNDLLELTPLDGKDWGKIFAAMFIHFGVVELEKLFLRRVIPKKYVVAFYPLTSIFNQ